MHRSALPRTWLNVVLVIATVATVGAPGALSLVRDWVALHDSESAGQEIGTLAKLSHKGWLCKTWEGELVTRGGDRTIPADFVFSVRSASVARTLAKHIGQPLVIQYVQHPVSAPSCFGDTEYFAEQVTPGPG
jgi:hypothetical protein